MILIGLFLLNLYTSTLMDIRDATQGLTTDGIIPLHILATLYCFLLGVLVEWRRVTNLVTGKTSFNLNLLLIPGLILLAISLLHPIILLPRTGIQLPFPQGGFGINMITGPLNQSTHAQYILGVISGILVIQGLQKMP